MPVLLSATPATSNRDVVGVAEATLIQVFTLVLWLTCLAVGVLGLRLEHRLTAPPPAPVKGPPPVQAELIDVDVTAAPMLASDELPAAPQEPLPADAPPPDIPPLPEVAAPSSAIAFALPVEGPVRIVAAARASAHAPPSDRPVVERLVFGQGSAGAQPEPNYPDAARDANEQGVVEIEFTVGPDGRVVAAHVEKASPWAVLNEAALSVVRDRWRNPKWSTAHPYLVPIRFQLTQ
jgi:TonB family protein